MRILNGSKLGDKKIRVNWSLSVANKQIGWLILMYCILMDHKFIIKLALSYQLYHTICSNASNQQLLTICLILQIFVQKRLILIAIQIIEE
jgi:hypothetical protein